MRRLIPAHVNHALAVVAGLCLVFTILACGGTPNEQVFVPDPLPVPIPVSVPEAWQACEASEDCVLVPKDCCSCEPSEFAAVNISHEAGARELLARDCTGMHCRQVCQAVDPFCIAGKCIPGERGNPPKPPSLFFVTDDAPAPQACTVDDDCTGNTVLDDSGCCNDPYSVIPHSKAYAAWMRTHRASAACTDVTCPEPPNPTMPNECYFEVWCDAGECANRCDF